MTYYPATDDERQEMLDAIGAKTFEDLIANIPGDIRLQKELNIPPKLSECETLREVYRIAEENLHAGVSNFLGAGSYDHSVPSAISAITGRSEFYTAYTPYQAEVSQGTLQAIYEYQTMICQLTGMDVSNASMYDGGSALAEAVLLAVAHTKRHEVVIAGALHPDYFKIIETYCRSQQINLRQTDLHDGGTELSALKNAVDENTAAVIVQHPNFYGCLEDVFEIGEITKAKNALYISVVNPISLGILTPPGEYGADIMVGEGQPLGLGLNFGGPYLGTFAVKEYLMRKIPGRLAGITVDADGERGFVLTLQTREQQIRREKATSNICTNQGLMMLAATVYMALLGKQGMQDVANICLQKSHYLAEKIKDIHGCTLKFSRPFFNEFVVSLPRPAKIVADKLAEKKILAGVPLSLWGGDPNDIMIAVTERRLIKELDNYVHELIIAVEE
jgi:glycine dehydrogenase subunit 1